MKFTTGHSYFFLSNLGSVSLENKEKEDFSEKKGKSQMKK